MADNTVEIRFGAATDDALAGIEQIRDALSGLTAPINSVDGSLNRLTAAFGNALPADAVAQLVSDFSQLGTQAQRTALQVSEIGTEIKLLHQGLAQQKIVLDAEVRQYKITQDEKYAFLKDATQKEYEAELALLQQKLALDGLSVQAKAKILNQIAELQAKHDTEMIKLDEQARTQEQQAWVSTLSPIETAFNSQLRGLLSGTTSWATAMKKIFGDLVIDIIEYFEKIAVEKAALGLTNLFGASPQGLLSGLLGGGLSGGGDSQGGGTGAATATGLTSSMKALTAVFTGGQAVTAAQTAATTAQTTATAAQTTATVAETSATTAETAAQSAGGGAGIIDGLLPVALASGTDYVMRGGLAIIHQGEAVVPAAARVSGPFTGAGMGTQVHAPVNISLSALDRQSVARFFSDNKAELMKAIRDSVRSGAHLGLRQSGRAF